VLRYYYGYCQVHRADERHDYTHNSWIRQGQAFDIVISGIPPFPHRQYFAQRTLLADTNFDYLMGSYGTPVPY
jgi:hypothetical protein